MKTDAEIYVELAVAVASHFFNEGATVDDLRAWWIDEAERRDLYGLSKDQCDQILDACREVAAVIPEKPKPKPKTRRPNRGAAL